MKRQTQNTLSSQERQATQMTATQMFDLQLQTSQSDAQKPLCTALCSQGYQAVSVCVYEKCNKRAFVCQDSNCRCRQQHKVFCSYLPISTLTELIEGKKFYDQRAIKEIEQKFDRLIDEISVQRDKVISQLKIFGLQKIDLQILILLRNQQYESLNGRIVSKLLGSLDQKQSQNRQDWKHSLDLSFSKELQEAQKKVQSLCSTLFEIVEVFKEAKCRIDLTIQSTIVRDVEKVMTLIQLFRSNEKLKLPKHFKLLYRASDNCFKVIKFKEICDSIPNTVVLVKTSHGKIIGGFTPLSWKKDKDWQFQADENGHSFVFSISENAKFTLNEDRRHKAINHRLNYGPQFGYDLVLYDSSNSNSESYANIGNYYSNPEFEYGNSSTWKRFTGNSNSKYFTAVEWEVHEVKF